MSADTPRGSPRTSSRIATYTVRFSLIALGAVLFTTGPALAQSTGTAFCDTALAETAKNIFTVIQFGGPLLGGIIALGATVSVPAIRRSDLKKELKETRNQAVIWGVIVAPLGATIIQFILNNVVAGGSSCGF